MSLDLVEAESSEEQSKPKHGLWTRLSGFLETGILVVVIALAIPTIVIPFATGGDRWVVISGSMDPALKIGTLTVTHPVEPADIEVGDILTYRHADFVEPITHRVIATHGTEILMKGDANPGPDAPIDTSQVIGKVSYQVPVIGTFARFVEQNRPVLLGAYASVAAIFTFGFFRRKVIEPLRGRTAD